MSIKEQIRVGDTGTALRFLVQEEDSLVNISGAVLKLIYFYKPDGSVVAKTASSYGLYGLQYITQAGDLNVAGQWRAQTYIGVNGGYWYSSIVNFRVHENLV